MKTHINISMDAEIYLVARQRGMNISAAAEAGIAAALNYHQKTNSPVKIALERVPMKVLSWKKHQFASDMGGLTAKDFLQDFRGIVNSHISLMLSTKELEQLLTSGQIPAWKQKVRKNVAGIPLTAEEEAALKVEAPAEPMPPE